MYNHTRGGRGGVTQDQHQPRLDDQRPDETADCRIIRVIMQGEDPNAKARDSLTRHLGMSLGASMVVLGAYYSYAWRVKWAWWVIGAIWALVLLHGATYLLRRRKAGPPQDGWRIEMEDDEPAPPEADTVDRPKHKITVIEPKSR